MSMEDYIYQFAIDEVYEPELEFHEPFWDFKYRFESLYRYWLLNTKHLSKHLNILEQIEGDGSAEYQDMFDETMGVDIKSFPSYLRLSTMSFSLSILERLLEGVVKMKASDDGIQVKIKNKKLPYIDRSIDFLINNTSLELDIDKSDLEQLNAIRILRNIFIHQLDRDLSNNIQSTLKDLNGTTIERVEQVNDDLVKNTFIIISNIVKSIELAYITDYKSQRANKAFKSDS
ncbi:hypothetical protein ACO14J_004431 [Vibrio parahaemolyticus]|uniref:hypothetical protein n=2 Tax=Vibrio parahaemolyticus TaxID=670 RepID=UPI00084AA439|nr:hypothetical protein [Vibrio parahaemolyticus]MBE4291559.1 hypothetical protein [Vibrio parahaemolyticus]MBE4413076.1 hypothetical protein [Vibrio parahaemolyticus]MCX8814281.1 hypothetical protein [Vibrio parahaemolyticus]MCX8840148.1 hypothetical protein [Vibrio parahaemolyticus]MCX8910787.1 hypothetical protein [Vibrio parahaemolyticus]